MPHKHQSEARKNKLGDRCAEKYLLKRFFFLIIKSVSGPEENYQLQYIQLLYTEKRTYAATESPAAGFPDHSNNKTNKPKNSILSQSSGFHS